MFFIILGIVNLLVGIFDLVNDPDLLTIGWFLAGITYIVIGVLKIKRENKNGV